MYLPSGQASPTMRTIWRMTPSISVFILASEFFGFDKHVGKVCKRYQTNHKQCRVHNLYLLSQIFSNQSIHFQNSQKQPRPLSRQTTNPIANDSIIISF